MGARKKHVGAITSVVDNEDRGVPEPKRQKISPQPISSRPAIRGSERQMEAFLLKGSPTPQSFGIVSEGLPIWLLSVEPVFTESVWFPGCSSMQEVVERFSTTPGASRLIELVVQRLGDSRVVFQRPQEPLFLVSGSSQFLAEWLERHRDERSIAIIDRHTRHRPKSQACRWKSIRHQQVGGATKLETTFRVQNLPSFTWAGSKLRRQIGDFIDYGAKPEHRGKQPSPDLTHKECLHPSHLGALVCFPSSYHASGFVTRKLSASELSLLFDLPGWLRQQPSELWHPWLPMIPPSLMDALLQREIQRAFPPPAPALPPRTIQVPPTSTWLPDFSQHLPPQWILPKTLPHSWVDLSLVTSKAMKDDKAAVPVSLWDRRVSLVLPEAVGLLRPLRRLVLLSRQAPRLYREARQYLISTHGRAWTAKLEAAKQQSGGKGPLSKDQSEILADTSAIRSALLKWSSWKAEAEGNFFNWPEGSTLLFWRWPPGEQLRAARDGMKPYIAGTLPQHHARAKRPKPEIAALMADKLLTIIERGYVAPGKIVSFSDFFEVEKGLDIRLVYNGTSCGLNEVVFAPNFWLPKAKSASRLLDFGYHSVDIDLGEMFLNFPLPEELRKYSGVNLSAFRAELTQAMSMFGPGDRVVIGWDKNRLTMRWTRTWMGLTSSPYVAVRFYYWAEEIVRGNPQDSSSALRWDKIRLNCPGDPSYDPSLPRVMKWNELTQRIANDLAAFVDDLRASGWSVECAWQAGRQIASRLQALGIQDAPRKRRPSVQNPGAWAGAIFETLENLITQSISQEKWDKAKLYIQTLLQAFEGTDQPDFDYKSLERIRGFLVHLSMTYEEVVPYLKGFHLTLASYLPKRDREGWKYSTSGWREHRSLLQAAGKLHEGEDLVGDGSSLPAPPKRVTAVPRFRADLLALAMMMTAKQPVKVLLRVARVLTLVYGFGDASGSGFGSSVLRPEGLKIRIGTWGTDSEDNSSNWREFENVVETLELEEKEEKLNDAEAFMFTDNSTVEAAIFKGSSSSPKLHNLVMRLKAVAMRTGCKIHVIHVSGERMKAQGSDGISRGSMKEGVAAGDPMMTFIPLHQTAIERSPSLRAWLKSWGGDKLEFLDPRDWFTRGHDHSGYSEKNPAGLVYPTIRQGHFVWSPPPAAAEVALEELRKARIKRQDSLHIIVIPRLMTPEWLKQLYKEADLLFTVDANCPEWPEAMFEPLIIAVCFPFLSVDPWQLKGTPKMLSMGRQLSGLSQESEVDRGTILRQFLLECSRLRSMPSDVVSRMLYFRSKREVPCEASRAPNGKRSRHN
jgi:hypothetical protein